MHVASLCFTPNNKNHFKEPNEINKSAAAEYLFISEGNIKSAKGN